MVVSLLWIIILFSAAILLYYLFKKGLLLKMLFPILYRLYASTRVGYYYHRRCLEKSKSLKHSITEPVQLDSATVYPLPYLADNYSYLIVNKLTHTAVVVDPADPLVVMQAVQDRKVSLRAILTTHKHWDHSGGNEELLKMYSLVDIYGGARDKPLAANRLLNDGDDIKVCDMSFTAISTPGHTKGHIMYLLTSTTPNCLFSGDHLFISGCGAVFEGSYSDMVQSLNKVKYLPSNTLIFPGHEYTYTNLNFAATVDPTNVVVQEKLKSVRVLRMKRMSTVPAVLSEELKYNPFLRTESHDIKSNLQLKDDSNDELVLISLRQRKDKFKM